MEKRLPIVLAGLAGIILLTVGGVVLASTNVVPVDDEPRDESSAEGSRDDTEGEDGASPSTSTATTTDDDASDDSEDPDETGGRDDSDHDGAEGSATGGGSDGSGDDSSDEPGGRDGLTDPAAPAPGDSDGADAPASDGPGDDAGSDADTADTEPAEIHPPAAEVEVVPYEPKIVSMDSESEIWEMWPSGCGSVPFAFHPEVEITHNHPVEVWAELRVVDDESVIKSAPMAEVADDTYRGEVGFFVNPEISAAEGSVDMRVAVVVRSIDSPAHSYSRSRPVEVHPAVAC